MSAKAKSRTNFAGDTKRPRTITYVWGYFDVLDFLTSDLRRVACIKAGTFDSTQVWKQASAPPAVQIPN